MRRQRLNLRAVNLSRAVMPNRAGECVCTAITNPHDGLETRFRVTGMTYSMETIMSRSSREAGCGNIRTIL